MSKFEGYTVIKKVVPKNLCKHITNYFLLKQKTTKALFEHKYISPFETKDGIFTDPMVPDSFCIYSDINCEVLLTTLRPIVEKTIGKNLTETYSYARVYQRGAKLKKHVDRPSCEFSITLNLGGDPWPIFINNKKINLKAGDMLVYEGCKFEHWRERFDGVYCAQVFLHYTDEKNEKLKYDGRPFLGLPSFFNKGENK
jgi:hypothetical protein|tara:strand:+ start:945 stop:1538 length:594 start_codon:yes stop_codon:yes gene_type:complete